MRTRPAALALLLAASAAARAEPHRHFAVGVGGFGALVGGDFGLAAEVEGYPAGRLGGRASYAGLSGLVPALAALEVSYEAGSTRRHFFLALHAGAAVVLPDADAGGPAAGIQAQLWLWGPLAIGLDSTLYLLFGGGDDGRFVLGTTFTARLAY